MAFSYYNSLSPSRRRVYDRSDSIAAVPIPDAATLRPFVSTLQASLTAEDRRAVEEACQQLADALVRQLGVPRIAITIRHSRPADGGGELHGLYEPIDPPLPSRIVLWMRTKVQGRVVAFKTFLRTLLHEICHHLDYELFDLSETFHTEGFYRRESSLFHQLTSGMEK